MENNMNYDFIIAGGGCAGLSLMYHILHTPELSQKKVLILDPEAKNTRDKTWCFWSSEPLPYASANKISWDQLEFIGPTSTLKENLHPLRYYHVDSLDFYQEVHGLTDNYPNVHIRHERVLDIEDSQEGAQVVTEQNIYQAQWVFNSIFTHSPEIFKDYLYTTQHFVGWFVKTETDTFNPDTITMMDFRVDQQQQSRFFYVLPFSSQEALVEFTVFSDSVLSEEEYASEIHSYLKEKHGLGEYTITNRERGVIPMTNYSFERKGGKHIVNIGMEGGQTKATSGYTFHNIQKDSRQIVTSLKKVGHPFYARKLKSRFRFYDNLLLYIIVNQGEVVGKIFERLFAKNQISKILTFLDENTQWWDEIMLLGQLPWKYFLKALWQYYLVKKRRVKPKGSLQ